MGDTGASGVRTLGAILYTLAVPGTLAVLVPWAILAGGGGPPPPRMGVLGWPLVAIGAWLVLAVVRDFLRIGRGTPAPLAPPSTLVGSGVYRWTRNPMYLGLVVAVLGEALVFWSLPLLLHALAMWAVMHAFLVWYEEPSLARRFGDAYEAYRRRVPRWLGF